MFDPSQPAEGSPLQSAVMRSQLTSLKALIDALVSFTHAQVDSTLTLPPGEPAIASVTADGQTLRFAFGIPSGEPGAQGQQGNDGQPGAQGPPFAQALVDAVNTLNPGDPATVSVTFEGTNVHFTFGIPRGAEGTQGPPGEVTNADLTAALATTALNPLTVQPLNVNFSDPPTTAELIQVQDKINELLASIKRP